MDVVFGVKRPLVFRKWEIDHFSGYDFWLRKLNQFNGDYVKAELVKAFITSDEYRKRFPR